MKARLALMLVLAVFLSSPVFSDGETCEQTAEFELGFEAAENQSFRLGRAILWGVGSFYVVGLSSGAGLLIDMICFADSEFPYSTLIGATIGMGLSIGIPALIVSRPKTVPDHISEEGVACYLEGYAAGTRRNRLRGAATGCAVFWIMAVSYVGVSMLTDY